MRTVALLAALTMAAAPVAPGETKDLRKGTEAVFALVFSPDSKQVAHADRTITLTDTATWTSTQLGTHKGKVGAMAYSPDGRYLVSGGWDRVVKLWDVANGKELQERKGHSDAVSAVAFSQDGSMLATGDWRGQVRLWKVVTGDGLPPELEHMADIVHGDGLGIGSMIFDRRGNLFVADWGGLIRAYSGKGRKVREYRVRTKGCRYVSFSPGGLRLLYGEGPKDIRIWDVPGKKLSLTVSEAARIQERIGALSPDGSLAVAVSARGGTVWDARTGKAVDTFKGAPAGLFGGPIAMGLAVSPNNRMIAVGYVNGHASVVFMD